MFNNPGTKIKGLAKGFFWVEVIGVVIAVLALGEELFEDIETIILAVVILAAGIAVAYITALFLAAFGELVETNTQLLEEAKKHNEMHQNEGIFTKN